MPRSRCVSRVRQAVIWGSFALAMLGWVSAAVVWDALGEGAGADGGFVMAIAVAIAFTVVCSTSVVMPDQAKLYALGWADRGKACRCSEPAPRLQLVERG